MRSRTHRSSHSRREWPTSFAKPRTVGWRRTYEELSSGNGPHLHLHLLCVDAASRIHTGQVLLAGTMTRNVDTNVVAGFGDEWSRFDQSALSDAEAESLFREYFDIFPWDELAPDAEGFDAGCGSGRWARLVAPRVGKLRCFDASAAAATVAARNLAASPNCEVSVAAVDAMPMADGTADFGYSLGVLHHIPDTAAALRDCVRKLRPGAPFLLYLYYRFDNRPAWYHLLWFLTNGLRRIVSQLAYPLRYAVSQLLAAV